MRRTTVWLRELEMSGRITKLPSPLNLLEIVLRFLACSYCKKTFSSEDNQARETKHKRHKHSYLVLVDKLLDSYLNREEDESVADITLEDINNLKNDLTFEIQSRRK